MSAVADRLVQMLRSHGSDIPDSPGDWSIRRTYAGAIQRSNGAFSFFLHWTGDPGNTDALCYSDCIGSQWPATFILKHGIDTVAPRYGDLHIYPINPIG